MLAVEAVTDLEGFRALKGDWNALALEANSSIFQTWEWSWYWWQFNGKGKRLWLLTARDSGKLVGLAPLFVSSSYYGLPLKVAAFIGTNGTDYLDFIINPDIPGAAEALVGFIFGQAGWDALDLHQIPQASLTADLISTKAKSCGFAAEKIIQDLAFNTELPDNWDDYLVTLSKKFRWNVQYYTRRLNREHEVVFRLSDVQSIEKDIGLFFKLHQKRFMAKKKPGAYLNPKFRKFHAGLAAALQKCGWLSLYVMEIDKEPVAALYGFSFADSFYYYLGGFEPTWGAMSVSTVLIARAIEDAISAGLHNFNFLRGQESYKQKWQAQESANYRLIVSRPGKKSGLAQKMITLESDLTKRVKSKLEG